MPAALEYDEEDLFDEGLEQDVPLQQVNAATPVAGPSYLRQPAPPPHHNHFDGIEAGPSRPRPPPVPCPPGRLTTLKPSVGLNRVRPRLLELRERREVKPYVLPKVGPVSLKQQCMAVFKANGTRIWDIGDVPYGLIKEFIDELPAEQLAAIEEASPQIREETDWLWEYFLLIDYSISHEKYALRKGEPRTSGWRRAYKRAAEEAQERQQNAAERVAERYKEMDKQRADKKIVVLNQVIRPQKARQIPGGIFGAQKPMRVTAKATGPLGKARADAQRARIALTHAAGKYTPQPTRRPHSGPSISAMSLVQPQSTGGRPAPRPIVGPRIPAPRPKTRPAAQHTPSSLDIIPGAVPTPEYLASRADLPSHLAALPPPVTASPEPTRFSVERKRKFSTIHQADVPNFQPPQPRPAGPRADFFGESSLSSGASMRPGVVGQGARSSPSGAGRAADVERTPRSTPSGANSAGEIQRGSGSGVSSTGALSAEAANKLKEVMFRTKRKLRAGAG